jgi:PiT family inorganic phosphate transporter
MRMTDNKKNPDHRYVNDLRRLDYTQSTALRLRSVIIPIGISVIFLAFIAIFAGTRLTGISEEPLLIVIAAVIGGYMAINIGANDVANNMGPAVGGKVLTVFWAIVIAAVCESAGALLAGGDVVKTVSKGIITPGDNISVIDFRYLMLSALLAAAVWINLATFVGAPVSTTHSIVGGVLGAGIAAAGVGLVNWSTMSAIAASWVISPVFGAAVAAALLLFIKVNILNVSDRLAAAKTWVPVLIGIMAAAFVAYMAMKGLKKIWKPSIAEIAIYALIGFVLALLASRPYILKKISKLQNKKKDINGLFDLPLIIGVAFLSFAHGANDVANAVGPLAAIVSTIGEGAEFSSQVSIPTWVMVVGAFGIAQVNRYWW